MYKNLPEDKKLKLNERYRDKCSGCEHTDLVYTELTVNTMEQL